MSRKITYHKVIGKGIEFFSVAGLTHVMRIEVGPASPFFIGSLTGKMKTVRENGRLIQKLPKRTLDEIAPREEKEYSLELTAGGVNKKLLPLWISNGTFFGDDCWNYNVNPKKKVPASWLTGPIVHRGKATASSPLNNQLSERWIFQQELNSNGNVDFSFNGRVNRKLLNPTVLNDVAPLLASMGWYSCIGGAGALIENGMPHSENFWYPPGKSSNPNSGQGGGWFGIDQTYCAGPVIAINDRADRKVLYILQDLTPENGDSRLKAKGRNWRQMALYLKNNFLDDIKRNDGSIKHALVYDGGGSRGLWVKGVGLVNNNGYTHDRPIPHHICVWGQVP